jgi:DNA-binding NarL/FixJ family response regulator
MHCAYKTQAMNKILIIDDSDTFRNTFNNALRLRFPDMEVDEAVNGGQAIEKITASRPDIIFMDIRMPGESGLDLTEKIKACFPEIRIIILTEYDLPEYRQAAMDNKADVFITKGSLKMSRIVSMIQSFLDGKPDDARGYDANQEM